MPVFKMRVLPLLPIAAGAFGRSTGDRAWQTIEHVLRDANPVRRSGAALAMALVRAQSTVLGGYKSKSSLPELREALNDDAAEVVFAPAKALCDMGDPAGRQVLIGVLRGDQPDASGFVSSSVRDVKLKLHGPALKQGLNDKNWTVRAAARAVALRDMEAIDSYMTLPLDDKREEVQYSAAAALLRLKQPAPKKTRA